MWNRNFGASRDEPRGFRKFYINPRHRIQLIRNIIAGFLFDQIFEPLAVGLSPEVSKALACIENDILRRGSAIFWRYK